MTMRTLITGGNRGLGAALTDYYNGDAISRQNGYDITKNQAEIAKLSLEYDVFINNAFDGDFNCKKIDFGQVSLLFEVADAWRTHNKSGWIINIGGVGGRLIDPPDENWPLYNVNKSALRFHSQQWTRAFRMNEVKFRTSLISIDRLDTELNRSRPTWSGNGHNLNDVISMIDVCLHSQKNTCVEEITAWVNLNF